MGAEGLADACLLQPSLGTRSRQVHVVEAGDRQEHHGQGGEQSEVHGVATRAGVGGGLRVEVDPI